MESGRATNEPALSLSADRRIFLFGLILIVSLALRLHAIGDASYWIDEMVSLNIALEPGLKALRWDNCPPLYHLLLKVWVWIFGDLEMATRLLSSLFSVGATAALIWFGTTFGGYSGGVALGFLHAISPLSVTYAQETRMYSLFELLTALSLVFFFRMLWRGDRCERSLGLSLVFLSCTHFLAVIPMALQLGWLGLERRWDVRLKKVLALAATVCAAIFIISFIFNFSWIHLAWQSQRFDLQPEARWPWQVLWNLAHSSWLSVSGFLILFFFGAVFSLKEREWRHKQLVLFLFVLIPLIGFLIGTFAMKRAFFLPRYFIYMLPFWTAGSGLIWLAMVSKGGLPKVFAGVAAALIISGSLFAINNVYRPTKAPWREVARIISKTPGSMAVTSRTAAVRTPYFRRLQVPLKRWGPYSEGADELTVLTEKYLSVWIVDNYWGSEKYLPKVMEDLRARDLTVRDYVVKSEFSEPLVMVQIQRLRAESSR